MGILMKKIPLLVRKSLNYSFYIVSGASTVVGLWGYTIKDINTELEWWKWAIILLCVFILVSCVIGYVLHLREHKPYTAMINGKPVTIKTGDIFLETGLKVIPFNERFDTQVDDIIIAHNTLNGKMIDEHVENIDDLNRAIKSAFSEESYFKPYSSDGKINYPLGRLIPYHDYLLLAFTHFDEYNQAYIGIGEYEQILLRMWKEMRRVYAAKHVVIPLLGAGITTIDGAQNKNYTDLLKCILCTLRSSQFQPEQGITIILTPKVIKDIKMNEIKEEF